MQYAYDDFNGIQQENDKLSQELSLYKKALELACEDCKRGYDLEYLSFDVVIGDVEDFKTRYLQQAKDEIDEQEK